MKPLMTVSVLLLGAALGLHPIEIAGSSTGLWILAGAGVGCFALTLVTSDWILAGPGLALLMGEYVWALEMAEAPPDPLAPIAAIAVLVLLELTDHATLSRKPNKEVLGRHAVHLAAVLVTAALVATAAFVGGRLVEGGSIALLGVAAACGVTAVGIATRLARGALGPDV
ncbi:MAG: hypothetical protein M3280_11795 [Actinomycetota bacterium]|nr:hypothetical protein [Actinomycetota bacterium]